MENKETTLKPLDSYLSDTRNPGDKMVSSLIKNVKSLTENPINSTTVPSLTLRLQNLAPLSTPQIQLLEESGFYTTSFFRNQSNPIPAPTSQYKTALINEIQLFTNVTAEAPSLGGFSPIVGVTDFTLDFYLSLWLFRADNGNITTQFLANILDDESIRLMSIKYTFNFFALDQPNFTISNSSQSFRLRDTIPSRPSGPDFTTNPTKITVDQYNRLVNSDNILSNMFGFDSTQFSSLSVPNQDLILFLFGDSSIYDPSTGLGSAIFSINVNAAISYFGITAAYAPSI
jgi:hypothetical protein